MFINFHAHPLHISWVINIFAIHCFFFPLVYLFRRKRGGGCTDACICMGTHSQPLLQYCLMDVYETW